MEIVTISEEGYSLYVKILQDLTIPPENESSEHSFRWNGTADNLANCYLAIVAICHQTSPIGERRLEGWIDGRQRFGWDYLKEKYLAAALSQEKLSSPSYWAELTQYDLAN